MIGLMILLARNQAAAAEDPVQLGTERWHFAAEGAVESSPALTADGLVCFGSYDGKVYALDAAAGSKQWEFATGALVGSSPAVAADGMIYVGSYDGKVYALDGNSGTKTWEFATGGAVYSSPALSADGVIYVGSGSGQVFALDASDGARLWEFTTGAQVISSPAIHANGLVIVGSADSRIYALDRATGAEVWSFPTGARAWVSAAIATDGTVFVGSADNRLYALDGSSGTKKWDFLTGGEVYGSPVLGPDSTVYFGSYDAKVYALDATTGAKKWEFLTGSYVYSTPALATDGTLYVGSWDGKLYAIDTATGTKRWEFATGDRIMSSPTIAPDGSILFGSNDGRLYAIAGSAPLAQTPWPMHRRDLRHTGNASSEEPPPPLGGFIVFDATAAAGGQSDIYRVDPDGSALANLTADFDASAWSPRLSPDGRRVAFASNSGGNGLWIMNTDGSGKTRLAVAPEPYGPALGNWLDDQSLLYYSGPGPGTGRLRAVSLDGSNDRVLVDRPLFGNADVGGDPRYSAAANQILFLAQAGSWSPSYDLYLANANGSNPRVFFEDPDDGTIDRHPIWSRNGQTVYWSRPGGPGVNHNFGIVRRAVQSPQPTSQYDAVVWAYAGVVAVPQATSPDDAWLLVSLGDGRLVVLEVGSGATRTVAQFAAVGDADWGAASGSPTAPSIVSQPQSQTVAPGATVSFTVLAAGTEPLSYQWRQSEVNLKDGGRLSGATGPTLTLSNVQASDSGSYDVVVSNTAGTVTSQTALLTVSGGTALLAYVADSVNGLTILDVRDPSDVKEVGRFAGAQGAARLCLSGSRVYLADGYHGIKIVDVTDPTRPALVGSFVTSGFAYAVVAAGNYAYVANGYLGTHVLDISDPSHPVKRGTAPSADPEGGSLDVIIRDQLLYVSDSRAGLQIVDVSDLDNPRTLSRLAPVGRNHYAVDLQGTTYYAPSAAAGLEIIRVDDPLSPVRVGRLPTSWAYDVAVSGATAYVADELNGIVVVDVADATQPTEIGRMDLPMAYRVVLAGSRLYVAGLESGLHLVDVSDPAHPALLLTRSMNGSVTDVVVAGLPPTGFDAWIARWEIPPDRRGPADRNGPLNVPNLLAYALGVSPLTARSEDMPAAQLVEVGEQPHLRFVYRLSKTATDAQVRVLGASSLDGPAWQTATAAPAEIGETPDGEAGFWQVTLPADGPSHFYRLEVQSR